jgi:hypothetical protein
VNVALSFEPSKVMNPPFVELLYVGPLFNVAVLELDVKLNQDVPEPGYDAILFASQ